MAVRWIMAACLLHIAVAFPLPDPGRLLRVPRIYNALITSDAKLQPSRAYAYSTPVFQPLGLGHVPSYDYPDQWEPPTYFPEPMEMKPEEPNSNMETTTTAKPTPKKAEENAKENTQSKKTEPPLTFYPRSFGFYQTQPIVSYSYPVAHHPFVYSSPFGFGHTFYKYPVLPYDGFHGGYLGFDHIESDNKQEKMVGEKENMKNGSEAAKESEELRSDDVGVREVEFLSDFEDSKETPVSADLKKADATEKS